MDQQTEMTSILIAGGCHVEGWPVGDEFSFGTLSAEALGAKCRLLGYVSLRNPSKLLDYLRLYPRPDMLVLQLGNYEAPIAIQKHFRTILGIRPKKRSAGAAVSSPDLSGSTPSKRPAVPVPPERSFQPSAVWRLHTQFKGLYALAGQLTRPRLFDADDVGKRLRAVLDQLAPLRIPRVVVLTPLPCADPMARHFRQAAGVVFKQECRRAGVVCLDSFAALGYGHSRQNRPFDIYTDPHHLNARGQRLLADALIPALRESTFRLSKPPRSVAVDDPSRRQRVASMSSFSSNA